MKSHFLIKHKTLIEKKMAFSNDNNTGNVENESASITRTDTTTVITIKHKGLREPLYISSVASNYSRSSDVKIEAKTYGLVDEGIIHFDSNTTQSVDPLTKILTKKSDVNFFSPFLKDKDLDMIRFLIAQKCYIKTLDQFQECLIDSLDNIESIKILFEEIPCVVKQDSVIHETTDITVRLKSGDFSLFQYFIDNDIISRESLLAKASYLNKTELIKHLITNYQVDLHIFEEYPLSMAVVCENLDLINYLINKGADVNNNRVIDKVLTSSVNIYKLMIEKGMKHDKNRFMLGNIRKYIEEQEKGMYFGIQSATKLDIILPNLLEIQRDNKYYYVYKLTKNATNTRFLFEDQIQRKNILESVVKSLQLDSPGYFYF